MPVDHPTARAWGSPRTPCSRLARGSAARSTHLRWDRPSRRALRSCACARIPRAAPHRSRAARRSPRHLQGWPILYRAMLKTYALALVAACALWSASARALEDPAAAAKVTQLSNGLVVVTLEDTATPVVSFQMWVKVGSRDEARFTGLAHLFEHMMFNGSKNLGPEEHAQLITARGGMVNAYTSWDQTVFFNDVTRESVPLVIDLEYERLANLDISEESLAREKQVVVEERRLRSEDQPMGRAYEALMGLLWQALPYRNPVIGWKSDVEKATVEVCRKFFDTYYAPNNIVVAIAGDFDSAAAIAQLERTFGKLPAAKVIP